MLAPCQLAADFLRNEDGPTAVECGVMLTPIIVVCVAAVGAIGTSANKVFGNLSLNVAADL
jgi:pilus assembly protein Flp/PilA